MNNLLVICLPYKNNEPNELRLYIMIDWHLRRATINMQILLLKYKFLFHQKIFNF